MLIFRAIPFSDMFQILNVALFISICFINKFVHINITLIHLCSVKRSIKISDRHGKVLFLFLTYLFHLSTIKPQTRLNNHHQCIIYYQSWLPILLICMYLNYLLNVNVSNKFNQCWYIDIFSSHCAMCAAGA